MGRTEQATIYFFIALINTYENHILPYDQIIKFVIMTLN